MSWKERLLSRDSSTFKKYIESTTAHGVVRIFSSKSIIRRLFWLVIVLAAAGGCLYNISDRIRFLISAPTSTTISVNRESRLDFPAVTVCNLNRFRRDVLDAVNLTDFMQAAFLLVDDSGACDDIVQSVRDDPSSGGVNPLREVVYEELSYIARSVLDDFIFDCYFAGEKCNVSEMFEPIFTSLGICYTFNYAARMGGRRRLSANGTGQRQGLQLFVNVDQDVYTTPIEAGVKIAIHPPSEPPLPDDQGIGIPTGRNAFISIRQKSIIDQTGRACKSNDEISDLNFLQGEYTSYSESACLVDCMQTSMANSCRCISSRDFYAPDRDSNDYLGLPNCTLDDICCIVGELLLPSECECPAACTSLSYDTSLSYSKFPADFISVSLAEAFINSTITPQTFPANLLGISVYFETLNIETQTTSYSYSFIALLSDIGGQLGLFLGVSVISIMEFGTWIVDEVKNRILGISEKKLVDKCCSCCQHESQKKTSMDEAEATYTKELTSL